MTLADDQAQLLQALIRNGVEFVVVGGVAAQLRGWSGATTDLDIAVASEAGNATSGPAKHASGVWAHDRR
jgi:hypothetical protein